jgi:hypothetical protein
MPPAASFAHQGFWRACIDSQIHHRRFVTLFAKVPVTLDSTPLREKRFARAFATFARRALYASGALITAVGLILAVQAVRGILA